MSNLFITSTFLKMKNLYNRYISSVYYANWSYTVVRNIFFMEAILYLSNTILVTSKKFKQPIFILSKKVKKIVPYLCLYEKGRKVGLSIFKIHMLVTNFPLGTPISMHLTEISFNQIRYFHKVGQKKEKSSNGSQNNYDNTILFACFMYTFL